MTSSPVHRKRSHRTNRTKIFLAMKITTILLFSGFLTASAGGLAQRVTLSANNVKLGKIFKEIKKQTGYVFFYDTRVLQEAKPVSIHVKNETVGEVLKEILQGQRLDFSILQKTITIVQKENQHVTTSPVNALSQYAENIPPAPVSIITGTVKDAQGQSLAGVSVIVKGTQKGTSTSADGSFSVDANVGDVLEFTIVGYQKKSVTLGQSKSLAIVMEIEVAVGEEVVIVGYGTQKKSDLTGSVAIVQVEDAKKSLSHDIGKMLQGQVPGVTVHGSGEPGSEVQIKIRGITSFGNNMPLFIIDGIPVNSLQDFSSNDIESMQVLKDASAGAIYGSRAAAGVIIITTKKGKPGPLRIDYDGYVGLQKVFKKIPVTNAVQYQKITNVAELNAGLSLAPGNDQASPSFISNVNTDWQKEALKTGVMQNHNLNLSGGNEYAMYNVALGYFDQEGNYKGPQRFTRYTVSANLQGKKNRFTYGTKLNYSQSHKVNPNQVGYGGSVASLLMAIPTMSVYDENRLRGYGGADNATQRAISLNVIGINNIITDYSDRNRFLGNVWGEFEIVKNFKYKLNLSYDRSDYNNFRFEPTYDLGFFYVNPIASMHQGLGENVIKLMENTLNYSITSSRHKISLLAGTSVLSFNSNDYTTSATGFKEPYYYTFNSVSDPTAKSISNVLNENKLLSYFGRINYNYDSRYLITFNYRTDGSSRFSPSRRFGNFPSIAAAWNVHNEHFISLPKEISSLKVRGGFGKSGNQEIDNYAYQAFINTNANYSFGTVLAPGATTIVIVDPDIKWEETSTFNLALDLGLLHEKLVLSAEYFNKETADMLVNVPIPLSVGSFPSSYITNAASVRNSGIEFNVFYRDNSHTIKYEINGNVSTLNNKVLQLGRTNNPIYGDQVHGSSSKTELGRSVGELFGFRTEGIFQDAADVSHHATQTNADPGDVKFQDINGDGIINAQDRVYLGTPIPSLIYGLNFILRYSNFDFSLFFQGNSGNKIYNEVYRTLMNGGYENHHIDNLNFWTPTNTHTNIPRPIIGNPNSNNRFSDLYVEDGSYVKLQNFQIAYSVSETRLTRLKFLRSARIYFSGQNVFTISKYRGYDPDFKSDGLFNRGFDYGSFPNPVGFVFGIQVSL